MPSPESLSSLELLDQYRESGDLSYFSEVYKRHSGMIYGICWGKLKNKEEAEDATIEIFEQLIEVLKTKPFDSEQGFVNWICTVTINNCNSRLRRRKTLIRIMSEMVAIEKLHAKNYGMDHSFDETKREIEPNKLQDALSRLNEAQRTCIELLYLESYRITRPILDDLERSGAPAGVLIKLEAILGKEVRGRDYFFELLVITLGKNIAVENANLILDKALLRKKMSYKEISSLTGYTLGSVRSHIQNGKINLKKMLGLKA